MSHRKVTASGMLAVVGLLSFLAALYFMLAVFDNKIEQHPLQPNIIYFVLALAMTGICFLAAARVKEPQSWHSI